MYSRLPSAGSAERINKQMKFGRNDLRRRQEELESNGPRRLKRISLFLVQAVVIGCIALGVIGLSVGFGVFRGIIDDAPEISGIDIAPKGFSSFIYDAEGNQTAKLVSSNSNRIPVSMDQIPENLAGAFVAIEDERFYSHNGIDIYGIFRAGVRTVQSLISGGDMPEGASTITQQLIKNNVFTNWTNETTMEKIRRKIQEQYLAVELEKELGEDAKSIILNNYLNTINMGHNTLGVQAASLRYFDKDVSDLTLGECAVLAAIPQNPTKYDPIENPEDNDSRRQIVLQKMLDQGMIEQEEYDEAAAAAVYDEIARVNPLKVKEENQVNSYFDDALTKQVLTDLQELLGYTESEAYSEVYSGGLTIHSTQSPTIQKIMDEEAADGANFPVATSYYCNYLLTVHHADGSADSNYDSNSMKYFFDQSSNTYSLLYRADSMDAAREKAQADIKKFRDSKVGEGDTYDESLVMTIQPQVSMTIIDQKKGYVVAMLGGRGKKSGNMTLNRATDTKRQPGSTFKVLAAYAPALEKYGYTLASSQKDEAFHYTNSNGSEGPQVYNYDRTYSNSYMAFRQAIVHSINTVAAKTITCLTSNHEADPAQGPINAYKFLVEMGFTTIIGPEGKVIGGDTYTDTNQSMALGGLTEGVKNIELTAAYAAIANGGTYIQPKLYTTVVDHDGNVLLDTTDKATDENRAQISRTVLRKTVAWLLTDAMEDVVTEGTGRTANFGTTAIAGKTGTTTQNKDVWFAGYTTSYTAAVWIGYDNNIDLNSAETGLARSMWRAVMERIPAHQTWNGFTKPDGLSERTVCKVSGMTPYKGICPTVTEYFEKGTVPDEGEYCEYHYKQYLEKKKKEEERKKKEAEKKKKEEEKKKAEEEAKKAEEEAKKAEEEAKKEAEKKKKGN